MTIAFVDPAVVPYLSTFLLVFATVFGLLTIANIGSNKEKGTPGIGKKVNAMIALAVALFSLTYEPLVVNLNTYIPYVVILLLALFLIVFVKKIFEGKEGKGHDTLPIVAAIAMLLIVMTVVGDRFAALAPEGTNPETLMWIAGIVFVILFFAAIYKHSSK
ncbi:hypothetical protein HYZ41_01095 [archaeon]|nr:hypothetical protein [archaeon]